MDFPTIVVVTIVIILLFSMYLFFVDYAPTPENMINLSNSNQNGIYTSLFQIY